MCQYRLYAMVAKKSRYFRQRGLGGASFIANSNVKKTIEYYKNAFFITGYHEEYNNRRRSAENALLQRGPFMFEGKTLKHMI